jgi:hypothetical protein
MSKDGISKYRLAHILVWKTFKGPIPDGIDINHENGDRNDPSLTNLEPMTRSENCAHSFRDLGRANFNVPQLGSRNGCAKLIESDIPKIFKLHADGLSLSKIAERFGVSRPLIGQILRGNAWRHISSAMPKSD